VRIERTIGHRERIATARVDVRVELVTAAVGSDGRAVRDAVASGVRGIVVQALGRGNVPPALLDGIRAAIAQGAVVVIASRCPNGATAPIYGYDGGGLTLETAGAVFAGDLPGSKARIKLMLLLGAGCSPAEVRDAFHKESA
jgi:L-asparaginase